MKFFTGHKTITTIKRQVYTGDKSTFSTVASNVTGYLRPLSEEASASNGLQFGFGFSLIVENDIDVQEGDEITIDYVKYTVRGVVNHDRGGVTAYKKALITKSVNV